MLRSVEVRWFDRGVVPSEISEWFRKIHPSIEAQTPRSDDYLILPENGTSLGIKLREGKIELKQRTDQFGVFDLGSEIRGEIEAWRKWSFELAKTNLDLYRVPTENWICVEKSRQIAKFEISPVSMTDLPDRGCGVELTKIRAEDQEWWTIGLEAFGENCDLKSDLSKS